ncbi:MAG: FG-GAP repeat protein [Acidobacteria bacterium]|nr:FG-GAP repeat protein [Acidobacteriota bacterium]
MKGLVVALVLVFSTSAFVQTTFDVKNASKYFDIKVKVEKCDDGYCTGKASFSFFKKNGSKPYQVIELDDTQIQLSQAGQPLTNISLLYDDQSVVNVGDFNFDGMEDVAICNGANGSYGGPSYNVYLSSRAAGKFVYSKEFSALGEHLGMFEVDKKRKRLSTLDKSGCCYHIAEEFIVVNNKPFKIRSVEEDATASDDRMTTITTKTWVGGKWKTTVTHGKREE